MISKLIYAFWFSGQMQAEVNARREMFSVVPDNLIALVCNAVSPSWSGSVGLTHCCTTNSWKQLSRTICRQAQAMRLTCSS